MTAPATLRSDRVLLSVVMPTHARARYAKHAIRSVLAVDSPELQLVVHDTSDDRALADDVAGIRDPRLRYVHCHEPLSMTENHNRAMALAEGEYVCLIGDDDSILPEALDAARWAARHGVPAIAPEVVANYAWPDFRSRAFGAGHAGRLYLKRRFGSIERRHARADLQAALGRAALGTDGLPKVYHGLVARNVMERVRERGGAYFYGTSPDVSGAVGIATLIDDYVWIDHPLTLPGASAGSNTGRSATKTHVGTVEDDPHTKRFRNLAWPDVLPRFASVETVWAHAVHSTLEAVDPPALAAYNLPRLYGACLLNAPAYREAVWAAARNWSRRGGPKGAALGAAIGAAFARALAAKAGSLARRALHPTAAGGRLYRDDLADIGACRDAFESLYPLARSGPGLAALLHSIEVPVGRR